MIKPANSGPILDRGGTTVVDRIVVDSGYGESEDDGIQQPKVITKSKDATTQEQDITEVGTETFSR